MHKYHIIIVATLFAFSSCSDKNDTGESSEEPREEQDEGSGSSADGMKSDPVAGASTTIATGSQFGITIRLDLTHFPDFVLTMVDAKRKTEETGYGLRDPEAKPPFTIEEGSQVLHFIEEQKMDKDGIKALVSTYKTPGEESSSDVKIFTQIESLDPGALQALKIDRAPFCIVQMDEYLIFPMNREGAPADERFQASGLIPFEEGDLWGYKDPTGEKVVIEAKFRKVKGFSSGLALVSVPGGGYGFIDTEGEFVIEPTLGFSREFGSSGEPDLALVSRDNKWGVIDKRGKFIAEPIYDRLGTRFYDGVIEIAVGENKEYKHGFLRKDGKVIVEPTYEKVFRFSEGVGAVKTEAGWGYVDLDGKIVIEPQFLRSNTFNEGLAGVQRADTEKWGYIDKTGKFVFDAKYDAARSFDEGLAPVSIGTTWQGSGMSGGKWGYIDKAGKVAIELKFDRASRFQNGKAEVRLEGKSGHVDKEGNFKAGQ